MRLLNSLLHIKPHGTLACAMIQISYTRLQKKYAGLIVALSKDETTVYAANRDPVKVKEELDEKGITPSEYIFIGPIPKIGTYKIF